ncbi:hypothetical protein Sjap_021214 [Stephania japonica]|uniref:Uncharacterized protein n=1 Tax=Stephania japonica TaxID=461633 RepID=A0AAP0F269_9MAGN
MSTKVGFCRVSSLPSSRASARYELFAITDENISSSSKVCKIMRWRLSDKEIGQETDFVLVSCAGLGIEPSRREQVIKAKKGRILFDVLVLVTPLFVQVLYGYSFTCLFVVLTLELV